MLQFIQFVADIGGTLGLWVGLSALSLFEVLQLILQVIAHVTCCRWFNNNPDVEINDGDVKKKPFPDKGSNLYAQPMLTIGTV